MLRLLALAALAASCAAIVNRHDKRADDFVAPRDKYPAVFPFPVKGSCGATLIDAQHAITGTRLHLSPPPAPRAGSHRRARAIPSRCSRALL
jgi:hypothetical protein